MSLTGSTDVGSHDHVDTLVDGDGSGTDKGNNNGSGGGGRLEEDGGQDTNHQSSNRVDVITEEFSGLASTHDLGSRSEKIKTKEEEVKEEKNETDSNEDESPFLRRVGAARNGDLAPGGVLSDVDELVGLFGFLLFDISHDESLWLSYRLLQIMRRRTTRFCRKTKDQRSQHRKRTQSYRTNSHDRR